MNSKHNKLWFSLRLVVLIVYCMVWNFSPALGQTGPSTPSTQSTEEKLPSVSDQNRADDPRYWDYFDKEQPALTPEQQEALEVYKASLEETAAKGALSLSDAMMLELLKKMLSEEPQPLTPEEWKAIEKEFDEILRTQPPVDIGDVTTERPAPDGVKEKKCVKGPIFPTIDERTGFDVFGCLYRRHMLGKKPSLDVDLPDLLKRYNAKIQAAKELFGAVDTMLEQYLSDAERKTILYAEYHAHDHPRAGESKREAGIRGRREKMYEILKGRFKDVDWFKDEPYHGKKAEQRFPEFPWDDFYLLIDLCNPATANKTSLCDFLNPDADLSKVEQWYKDLASALDNLGIEPPEYGPDKSWLTTMGSHVKQHAARIDEHYGLFWEGVEATLAIAMSTEKAWNNFVEGLVVVGGVALGAVSGGSMVLALAMGTTQFVLEKGAVAMGAEEYAAKIFSSLVTAGLNVTAGVTTTLSEEAKAGVRAGMRTGVGTAFVEETVEELGTSSFSMGPDAFARLDEQSRKQAEEQAKGIAGSMMVLNDREWKKFTDKLKYEHGYDDVAIARINDKRDTLCKRVNESLSEMYKVHKSLSQLLPAAEAHLKKYQNLLNTTLWKQEFKETMERAYFDTTLCCKYSDGSGPSKGTLIRIPEVAKEVPSNP